MTLHAIKREQRQWTALISAVYKGDVLLLAHNHVAAPCTLAMAVADTYLALRDQTGPTFTLYGLRENGQGDYVGMVGVEREGNCLVTFGLALPYRTAEGAAALAAMCRNLLQADQPAYCCLYERNLPARRFVQRLGFVASPERLLPPLTKQPGIFYALSPSLPCP